MVLLLSSSLLCCVFAGVVVFVNVMVLFLLLCWWWWWFSLCHCCVVFVDLKTYVVKRSLKLLSWNWLHGSHFWIFPFLNREKKGDLGQKGGGGGVSRIN